MQDAIDEFADTAPDELPVDVLVLEPTDLLARSVLGGELELFVRAGIADARRLAVFDTPINEGRDDLAGRRYEAAFVVLDRELNALAQLLERQVCRVVHPGHERELGGLEARVRIARNE